MKNTVDYPELSDVFVPDATHPSVMSWVFDQQEVCRVENGEEVFVRYLNANDLPHVMQQFWNGELVLELFPRLRLLTVNRLSLPRALNFGAYGSLH